MFEFFHKRPHFIYSLIMAMFFIGIYGLITMPKNLFPSVDRPMVIVVIPFPINNQKVRTEIAM